MLLGTKSHIFEMKRNEIDTAMSDGIYPSFFKMRHFGEII